MKLVLSFALMLSSLMLPTYAIYEPELPNNGIEQNDLLNNLDRIFSHDLPIPKDWLHGAYDDSTPAPSSSYSFSYDYHEDVQQEYEKDQTKVGDIIDNKQYDPKASIVKMIEKASFNKARHDQYLRGALNKQPKHD